MNSLARTSLSMLILLLSPDCATGHVAMEVAPLEPPDYWPTDGWRTSTPEAQGMDSKLLAEAVEFVMEDGCLYLHGREWDGRQGGSHSLRAGLTSSPAVQIR